MISPEKTWTMTDLNATLEAGLHVLCLYPHPWMMGAVEEEHCACGHPWPCSHLPAPPLCPEDVDD